MTFKKPVGPNGTEITMVSWKAGSRQGRPAQESSVTKFSFLQKMVSKRYLFENHKNRKWHQHQTFHKSSALGPSKDGLGERFWTNMKNRWTINRKISIVFDDPKPLKSIEKQTLFLISGHSQKRWKNDARGDLKSHVFLSKMATWDSQFRKSLFLDAFPMDQQIEKIEPWGAKGRKKCPGCFPEWWLLGSEAEGRLARGTTKQ